MTLPHPDLQPDDPESLPPARRRRARRLLAPLDSDDRAAGMDRLAHRVSPNLDFYLFSLVSSLILSIGLLKDSQALLLLGLIFTPWMSPVVGISLGTVTGAGRLFLRNLVGLLLGSLVVLAAAYAAGRILGARFPGELALAQAHIRLDWPDLLVMLVGATLTTYFFTRWDEEAWLSSTRFASLALAYVLYLPLVCAGLGYGMRLPLFWPDGLVIFLVHLVLSVLVGTLTLAVMGLKPLTPFGYTIGGVLALVGFLLLLGIGSFSAVVTARIGLPTATFTLTPTPSATFTITPSPIPPTATLTSSSTPSPTLTPSQTPTITPTPVLALVRSDLPQGLRIRQQPNGETIGYLTQNTWVVLLPGTIETGGTSWVQVIAPDGVQGWIVRDYLLQITPTPSATS